jgi:nicotinamidase-related amidase
MKNKTKYAILVIDMLEDMINKARPFKMPIEFKRKVIPNISKFLLKGRQNKMPIIYVSDAHRPNDPEFIDFQSGVEHAIRGTKGAKIIEEVYPKDGDFIVEKRRFSGFFGTDLELLLNDLCVNSVVFVGRPTNVCVLYTAADAFSRGYSVFAITDCLYSKTEKYHLMGLQNMFFAEKLKMEEFYEKFGEIN